MSQVKDRNKKNSAGLLANYSPLKLCTPYRLSLAKPAWLGETGLGETGGHRTSLGDQMDAVNYAPLSSASLVCICSQMLSNRRLLFLANAKFE